MIRFHQLLIAPNEPRLTRHQATAVWDGAQATVESNIYGPHLEGLAREWTLLHAAPETLGGDHAHNVGAAEVPCREHRGHQVDVVAMHGKQVIALGEAKWRPVTSEDADRLRHIRDVTPGAGGARLLLFTAGTPRLRPHQSRDVEVVDLERLYTAG